MPNSLRERVASAVGWKYVPASRHHCPKCGYARSSQRHEATCTMRVEPPPYDTSADAALEAYAVLKARGWRADIRDYGDFWEVAMWSRGGVAPDQYAKSATLAEAICEAICQAAGREKA